MFMSMWLNDHVDTLQPKETHFFIHILYNAYFIKILFNRLFLDQKFLSKSSVELRKNPQPLKQIVHFMNV